jgi:hypothetical protein
VKLSRPLSKACLYSFTQTFPQSRQGFAWPERSPKPVQSVLFSLFNSHHVTVFACAKGRLGRLFSPARFTTYGRYFVRIVCKGSHENMHFSKGVMNMIGPYANIDENEWQSKTIELINDHPLDSKEIVEVVLSCWETIFESRLGGKFRIGYEIQPKPQIMGFLLHELIPLELQSRYPSEWRPEKEKFDKDLVYIPNPSNSIELKTSSHPTQIFGNRSYAQEQIGNVKSKNGYYLTVNFEKFNSRGLPRVTQVRFGWLDHSDWIGQASSTGQQARIRPESDRAKLLKIYSKQG